MRHESFMALLRRKAFTLIELLVVVAIIALLISILLPSLARARELSKRTVCAANIKGIGTAIASYANENEQDWPCPGFLTVTTTNGTGGTSYVQEIATFSAPSVNRFYPTYSTSANVSVTRGFWMLVKDGSTAPKQFTCPSTDDAPNTEQQPELYFDFVNWNQISYGMQIPFGGSNTGKPTTDRDPRMPLSADKGPAGAINEAQKGNITDLQNALNNLTADSTAEQWRPANSQNHTSGDGQNILYSDFHAEWQRRPIEGIGFDNVYTRWSALTFTGTPPNEIVRGTVPSTSAKNIVPFRDTDTLIYP